MTKENKDKRDKIIRRIEELTSDMQEWPSWKQDIDLTDATTFTITRNPLGARDKKLQQGD